VGILYATIILGIIIVIYSAYKVYSTDSKRTMGTYLPIPIIIITLFLLWPFTRHGVWRLYAIVAVLLIALVYYIVFFFT